MGKKSVCAEAGAKIDAQVPEVERVGDVAPSVKGKPCRLTKDQYCHPTVVRNITLVDLLSRP